MPSDPKNAGKSPDGDEDADEERPTAVPPFDPVAFARDVLDPPPGEIMEAEEPFGTPTKVPSSPPLDPGSSPPFDPSLPLPRFETPKPATSNAVQVRTKTASGALSLANMRAPTSPPPVERRPPKKSAHSSEDRDEKTGSELDTRPPPGGRSPEEHAQALGPRSDAPPNEQEMSDRVSLGDYTGALAIAEKLLEIDRNNAVASSCAENCRTVLHKMYTSRIGPLDKVPIVMVPRDQLRWLSIDHRAGFVLSLVDGVSSVEMILDVSGMQELDALRILSELAQQRIIGFR